MKFEMAQQVANAVLYEGYLLYPIAPARRKISCAGSSVWSCRATTARTAPASRG